MYRIFFIRASVDGSLVAVNSAAVSPGVHVFLHCDFFQGIHPGVGLLGHMAVLVF